MALLTIVALEVLYTLHSRSGSFSGLPFVSVRSTAPVVTMAEYDQVQKGMSYEQVTSIIGTMGTEISRSDLARHTTVMYSWKNANGSNMNAMFQDGELVIKAQFGLP